MIVRCWALENCEFQGQTGRVGWDIPARQFCVNFGHGDGRNTVLPISSAVHTAETMNCCTPVLQHTCDLYLCLSDA